MSDSFYIKEFSSNALVTMLKDKVTKLKQVNRQLKHDLREQLFVIKSSLQILKMKEYKKFDKKTKADFDRMERAISRLEYKVDNLSDHKVFTGLLTGKILITNLIRSVLDRMHIPKTVSINISGDAIVIECDQRKLQVVFLNLILNAIQAMKSKGNIEISTADEGNYVTISVQDTGPGVPADKSSKIFDSNYTTRPTGTGLGLASCKNFVEQHGGNIQLKPKKGKGANFVIQLPKAKIK